MLVPVVVEWAKKRSSCPTADRSATPRCWAACVPWWGPAPATVVGGLLAKTGVQLGLFTPAWVGLPGPASLLYLLAVAAGPARAPAPLKQLENARRYRGDAGSPRQPVIGKTIEEAGLRHFRVCTDGDRPGDEVLVANSSQEGSGRPTAFLWASSRRWWNCTRSAAWSSH